MNFVRSNDLSLKYQGFTPSGRKDIEIRKFEFEAKIYSYMSDFRSKYVNFIYKIILIWFYIFTELLKAS